MIPTLIRAAATAALLFALPTAAQTVQGHVTESQGVQPVAGAQVWLLGAAGDTVGTSFTDAAGAFRIEAPAAGEFRLRVERMGFLTTLTRGVPLDAERTIAVEVRMRPDPVVLQALTPTARRRQGISGRVLDDDTQRPVPGATVTLMTLRERGVARAVTDSSGYFHLRVPRADGYVLRTERMGFRPATSGTITVTPSDTAEVEVHVSTTAVLLAPLAVVAASRQLVRDHQLAQFEWRRQRQPFGRYFGPEEIRHINPFYATDVLQHVPFAQVSGRHDRVITLPVRSGPKVGSRCVPTFYVDGQLVRMGDGLSIDEIIRGRSVAAVEAYDTPAQAPGEFPPMVDDYCGVIVIWTRVAS
ncbi:MAG: carboxypeptidase-like regulatory domain-containing protein [Gemmatimonadetes bacterium]|nr:carboxypeptidase-like regulatory domain-containing protein [Gemmatimonadota bacterium]